CLSTPLHPPRSSLFPYTTLFRSSDAQVVSRSPDPEAFLAVGVAADGQQNIGLARHSYIIRSFLSHSRYRNVLSGESLRHVSYRRSEEHTSELQSLAYLVCRLLLE